MKQFLVLLMLLCSTVAFGQDVIVKKDGSTIVCRVVELTSSEIVYKKWSDLNGSNYVMNRTDASAINYENGKKVNLSEATNLYQPHNQNDGVQQYNDNALLRLDYASQKHNPYKKAKTLRTIGWVGAIPFVGMAIYCFQNYHSGTTEAGLGFLGVGALWTSAFVLTGNHIQKKADSMLQTYSIIDKKYDISRNATLSAGIDMLNDNTNGNNTIGIGLRYNF